MANLLGMARDDVLRLAQVRQATASGAARELRISARLSRSEAAEFCGVDQSTIWRWENAQRTPRGAAALRYARLLETLAAQQSGRAEAVSS